MSWRAVTIGDLVHGGAAEIQTGPFGTQLKASQYVEDGTPVINVRNIGYGCLKPDKLEHVAEETTERLAAHLLEPDDIVFGRKGAVDRHLYVTEEQAQWLQGSDCIRLRFFTDDVVPRFASYSFLTMAHQKWMLAQSGNKATMASLNHDIIKRISIRLPAPAVQRDIVAILSAFDDLIENNRRRMALLEEAVRQLYREWFVRLRFPGHEHVKIKDGVPEGWKRNSFGELVEIKKGKNITQATAQEGTVPVVAGGLEPAYYHDKANAIGPVVTISASGANAGFVSIYNEDIWASDCSYISSKSTSYLYYFYCLLKLRQQEIFGFQQGAAQPHVYPKDLMRLGIVSPQDKLIRYFTDAVEPSFALIKNLNRQNKSVVALRDLLLPRLMSGEIAV